MAAALREGSLHFLDVDLLDVESPKSSFRFGDAVSGRPLGVKEGGTGRVPGDTLTNRGGQVAEVDRFVVDEQVAVFVHEDANELNAGLLEKSVAGIGFGGGTGGIGVVA